MPRHLPSILAAALALATLKAGAQDAAPSDSWPADLEAAVRREREAQGLKPVAPSAALRRAAQAHVDDMVRGGYFALEGPAGSPTIESLVDKEGYRYTLVTEKLVRGPLEQTADEIAAGWRAAPGASRSSLFLPEIQEVGAGVAVSGDQRLIAIVLANGSGPAATRPGSAESFAALARDPEAARRALAEAVLAQRRAWGLSPLRLDARLGEAAARHAQDLLAARLANRPAGEVVSLADLVAEQRERTGAPVEVSGEVSRQRRHGTRGTNGVGESVGQVIVTDAATAAEALQTALRQDVSALRDARYRALAIGLAVHPPAQSVWVIAVATH